MWYTINLKSIAKQDSFRPDPKFRRFWDVEKGIIYPSSKSIPFRAVLEELKVSKFKKGELDDTYYLLNISDQRPKTIYLENIEEVEEIGSDKNPLSDADIIISKLGLPKGYIFLNEPEKYPNLIGSTELIPYKLINPEYSAKFIKYLLLLDKSLNSFACLESGKTPSHKRVNPFDILKAKIPYVPKEVQDFSVKKIEFIERDVIALKAQIKEPLEIINEIFAEEFIYSTELWKEFSKGMTAGTQKSNPRTLHYFPVKSSQCALSEILRFSSRYHNPVTIQLNQILEANELWHVEDVVKDIKKGIQPIYDTDGDVKVVKIANMKNGYIDFTEAELVSEKFYESVKDKAGVEQGDILLCCTGKVSLGKIDYYNLDESAILSVDSYIIRVNEKKVHPLFFTYFFRGILGAYQIERDYTGTTNQIHLYDSQIRDFMLPKIDMKHQQKIVDQVKKALDEQRKVKNQIEEKQKDISKIIENAIEESQY